jgi:hypothetical protein
MPDPHPAPQSDDIWQMNATNQFDPPCQHPVDQTEGRPDQLRPNVHPPVAETMKSDCPETGFEEVTIEGLEIFAEKSEKPDSRRIEIPISPV